MVDVTPLVAEGQQVIRSYAPGRFVISGVTYHHAVIVFPEYTVHWGFSGCARDLELADFEFLKKCTGSLDILLVGCGGQGGFFPELKKSLRGIGVVADFMDTGAACRTYNVLMAEGRRVAAALILP